MMKSMGRLLVEVEDPSATVEAIQEAVTFS
jgi:hypothetical protein